MCQPLSKSVESKTAAPLVAFLLLWSLTTRGNLFPLQLCTGTPSTLGVQLEMQKNSYIFAASFVLATFTSGLSNLYGSYLGDATGKLCAVVMGTCSFRLLSEAARRLRNVSLGC